MSSQYQELKILVSLIEMLVVLLIISVLMLLFVPNLSSQKDAVKEKGNAAVVKVVESQAELYNLNNTDGATIGKLRKLEMISDEQIKAYEEYVKNGGTQKVPS